MIKFDLELKKKFVALMESNKYSINTTANELGISVSSGKRWWRMYQLHGDEGLSMKSRTYSGEFKRHVVKYMHENHLSVREASAMFDIPSHATLLKWKQIYTMEGESVLLIENRGRPRKYDMKKDKIKLEDNSNNNHTKEDLILEVKRLRAEVAYLKKSIALKEEKRSLQTKKR